MFNFIHIFTEMLRANLALKIKSSKFDENLENLSSKDFNNIALTYCQQVGIHFYRYPIFGNVRRCKIYIVRFERVFLRQVNEY